MRILSLPEPELNTRIQDIEIIDIRGSGNNTLKLNLNDLLAASTSTNIHSDRHTKHPQSNHPGHRR
jgi:hypothetical protein